MRHAIPTPSFKTRLALVSCLETSNIVYKDYLSAMYEEDARQPQWHHLAYNFAKPKLLNSNGRLLVIPQNPNMGSADIQLLRHVHCVFFEIIVDPSHAYGKCQVPVESFKAAVALPAVICLNACNTFEPHEEPTGPGLGNGCNLYHQGQVQG
jgi:hypothetical protein